MKTSTVKNYIHFLTALFFFLFLSSCKYLWQESQKVSKSIAILPKENYGINKLDYAGSIIDKRIWQDVNGENIVLFTYQEEEIYIYHYAIKEGAVRQLMKIYDFVKNCQYDTVIDLIKPATFVTDLDNNQIAEITFAYKKGCISDISPLEIQLLKLENGKKHTIRGTTIISMPGQYIKGKKNIDEASFYRAPHIFLSHSKKIWAQIEGSAVSPSDI